MYGISAYTMYQRPNLITPALLGWGGAAEAGNLWVVFGGENHGHVKQIVGFGLKLLPSTHDFRIDYVEMFHPIM